MKANRKVLNNKAEMSVGIVGTLVALLFSIILGVMIFWSLSGSMPLSSSQAETKTSTITGTAFVVGTASTDYATGTNNSAWAITLNHVPSAAGNVNITCYNSSGIVGDDESYPTFTLSNRRVDVAADGADSFDQVNVTYTTKFSTEKTGTETMANTVFALLPIIALVVVASIILGIVLGFGSGKKGSL